MAISNSHADGTLLHQGSRDATTNVVICLTTFNRVDCARINMELIKLNYSNKWPIVHACSDINYEKYIEDVLINCDPNSLHQGALSLLQAAIKEAHNKFAPEFFVHLEADTWLMNQHIIEKYIDLFSTNDKAVIASSSWSYDRTVKLQVANKVLPKINYYFFKLLSAIGLQWSICNKKSLATQFFIAKNTSKFRNLIANIPAIKDGGNFENILFSHIKKIFGKQSIIWITEREPVHPNNRDYCDALELYCQHYPTSHGLPMNDSNIQCQLPLYGKKEILERYSSYQKGPYMTKLLNSCNLDYYNNGAKRDLGLWV